MQGSPRRATAAAGATPARLTRAGLTATALTVATAGWCGPGAAAHCAPLARLLGVPRDVPGLNGVGLSFDDGPHPEHTLALLEELERAKAPATFFLVGEQVERYPSVAAEIVARGHEPGVHAYRHRCQMRLTPREFAADLARAVDVIGSATGRPPRLYRPPYGVFTLPGLAAVRRAGLSPLLWSRWGRDWRAEATPRSIAQLAVAGLRAGDVVLLHDADWYCHARGRWQTGAALPLILAELERRCLPVVAITPGWRPRH